MRASVCLFALAVACGSAPPKPVPDDTRQAAQPAPPIPETPPFLPAVEESQDNPTTPEKVALGYKLFYDKRLSRDGSMSCESCHHPDQAYTSGNPVDPRVGGSMNKRNAPTMENA